MRAAIAVLGFIAILTGCVRQQVDPVPAGIENDQVIPDGREVAARASARVKASQELTRAQRDSAMVAALTSCTGSVCDSLANGVAAVGMNKTQILAVTGSSPASWRIREASGYAVMHPQSLSSPPRDNSGDIVMVQLRDERVTSVTYQTPLGIHVVSRPGDATRESRIRAQADLLIREGDEYAANGDLDRALDRYDRAHVLVDDPMIEYRIATVLDKQLRPIEALLRYQRFLHEMELERIEARGQAAAHMAEAIAHARERVLIIERNR